MKRTYYDPNTTWTWTYLVDFDHNLLETLTIPEEFVGGLRQCAKLSTAAPSFVDELMGDEFFEWLPEQ
jgi:hypothetical protein